LNSDYPYRQPLGLNSSDPQEFAEADLEVWQRDQKMLRGEIPAQDMGPIVIQAAISRITFARDGFIIARIEPGLETILGNMTEPVIGQEYRLTGNWVNDPRWGRQFKFTRYVAEIPQSTDGIYRYLVKVAKWVGPAVGRCIVDAFGEKALEVLKHDPQRSAVCIKGLTLERAEQISKDLLENEDREAAAVELESMMGGQHLPKHTIPTLIAQYHSDAPARVRANPYMLIEVRGIGFLTADRVAMALGFDRAGIERRMAATTYALQDAADSQGHTLLPNEKLIKRVKDLIGLAPGADASGQLVADGKIKKEPSRIGLADLDRDETDVAGLLRMLLCGPEQKLISEPTVDLKGLAPDQQEAFHLCMANPVFILTGAPGTGKAQPLDAQIITPSGPRRMGDIQAGDPVMGYRVTFSDGSSTECCEDHLWTTTRRDERYKRGKRGQSKTHKAPFKVSCLKEIMGSLQTRHGNSNHSIPMTAPLHFTQKEQPIDPYLMGLLLGDGCFRTQGSVGFSKPDEELLEAFDNLLPTEVRLVWQSRDDYRINREKGYGPLANPITVAMRDFGLMEKYSHEKFIPDCYLFSNVTDRIGILQGLMDTDGYADGTNAEFSTSSKVLASQLQFITESLGGTARIVKKVKTSYTHNGEKRNGHSCYRMNICLPPHILPFRLRRKADVYVPKSKYLPRRVIRSITPVGFKQVQCISVDAPDDLYLTDHCILTHNTYTLRRIIEQFVEWNKLIALTAPTGKAAKRMSEMIGMPASTIHRLLEPEPYQSNGETKFSFHYGVGEHLPNDVVVIDEFSMVDVPLAASLFRAIAPGTRVLIVGDHYQLPSVGPGAVLRDLLAAGVPSYELTEIKRNTGDIVRVCHAIKDGRPAIPSPALDPEAGYNLRHIEESDPTRIQQIIREIVCERMPRRPEGYDPVWDVQCLSPMNERTELSCLALNKLFQEALNIHPPIEKTPFRIGDKVIQRKNQDIDGEFIVNGDLGEIEEITSYEIIVNFKYPDRRVRVKRNENHLALAYCITIHKAQGSEAPVIILPLHSSFGAFFNRELVYTGISRARDICITVGEWGALQQAAGRVGNVRRITRLAELLADIDDIHF